MKSNLRNPIRALALLLASGGILLLAGCGTFEISVAIPTSPTAQSENDDVQFATAQEVTQIVTRIANADEPPESTATPVPDAQGENSDIAPPSDQNEITSPGACRGVEANSAKALACAIQEALINRDMITLESLMTDPFIVGYWQSEGRIGTPAEIIAEIDQSRLPADTSGLTFTVDRSQFPDLLGMSPENMFGPDINIVLVIYSQGWGADGQEAALLLIAQNANGKFYWPSMLYGMGGF